MESARDNYLSSISTAIILLLEPHDLAENLDTSVRDEYRRLWQNVQDIPAET
jgi:hypothetical protein